MAQRGIQLNNQDVVRFSRMQSKDSKPPVGLPLPQHVVHLPTLLVDESLELGGKQWKFRFQKLPQIDEAHGAVLVTPYSLQFQHDLICDEQTSTVELFGRCVGVMPRHGSSQNSAQHTNTANVVRHTKNKKYKQLSVVTFVGVVLVWNVRTIDCVPLRPIECSPLKS